ncbi:P-loop containing nucleoside triphosphate hydrolase protein [Pholiota molesta]|nr:P-loop containing nucleoside triphosphate hydrolase protein [Pholiota molesta]
MDGKEPAMSIFTSHSASSQSSGDVKTISSSDYARKCRDLMGLYNDLLDLGAEAIFDLPRVVVIGGQSSGKSSLVEAVSGINVPRDSGTCTRCPMVCTMSSDASSWSCRIEISYEYNADGTPLGSNRTEPFGPALIGDKDAVELWIRRAQAAILSPHRPPSFFVNLTAAELRNNAKSDMDILPFSKNVVHVKVQDPEATDLSFVDLPGLIQNADEDLITIVRTLVESYVIGQNTLIVIAMPMSDDIENMQAVTLAGKADPEKDRTIGVLTKPDTLTKGSTGGREKWKAVLEGREIVTTHGYYCVRLPDDDERERKITPLEAQRNAAHFFDTTAPWDKMVDRTRFGIPNFVSSISALLVDRIERNLPDLRKAVEVELALCHQEISRLPPLSNAEPSTEIILRVNAFCRDVSEAVRGDRMDRRFIQMNKARYLRYKNDIMMTTPDFRPFEDDETSGSSLVDTRTASRSLSDVRRIIKQSIGWELPGEIPFEATTVLIKQYTGLWSTPSISCFEDVTGNLDILLKNLLHKHFGQYKDLEKYASDLSLQERDRCIEEALCSVKKILALESYPLFTQNFDLLASEEKKWVDKYKTTRHAWLQRYIGHSPAPYAVPYVVSPVSRPGPTTSSVVERPARPTIIHFFPKPHSGSESEDTPTTWTIEEELKIIANVQAYFQVAYKRIIDYVPLTIEHELNQNFASAIAKTLLSSLFKDSEEGKLDIQGLLKEDPVIERKRQYLNDRRIRLFRITAFCIIN